MPVERIDQETGMRRFSRIVLCLYFILSIFEPYLNGLFGSLTKFYIFFVIGVLIYECRGWLCVRFYSKIYILWFCYKLMTLLWSQDYVTPRAHIISQVGMVLFLVVLFAQDWDAVTMHWIERVSWLASGALGVLGLFFTQAYHGRVTSRQVIVIAGVEMDPNNQAVLLLVGITISLVYLFYYKRHFLLAVGILAVNTYGCFQSGSRSGVITLIALVVLCILLPEEQQSPVTKLWKILALVGIVLAAVIAARRYLSHEIYERLFDFAGYDDGSGRSQMWSNVWHAYTDNLFSILFGIGWGTSAIRTGAQPAVHNTFLTMLCDVGLAGTLLFLYPIWKMMRELIRDREMFPVLLAVAMLVPSFFLDSINKRYFWNAIFLLGMYYYSHLRMQEDAESAAMAAPLL